MKRCKWMALGALCLLVSAVTEKSAAQADGWITLFNGKDLTGWKLRSEQYNVTKFVDAKGEVIAGAKETKLDQTLAAVDAKGKVIEGAKVAKLDGKDVQAELRGELSLRSKLPSSRLDLDGWFTLTPAFLEREKKFESLLQLGESLGGGGLGKAKDEEGHYYFAVRGTVQAPNASLARDAGKRAKQKASKSQAAPAAAATEATGG